MDSHRFSKLTLHPARAWCDCGLVVDGTGRDDLDVQMEGHLADVAVGGLPDHIDPSLSGPDRARQALAHAIARREGNA